MGRVSTSSPARDAERRRSGGTVLDAVLERITYANDETGYTIARVATDRSGANLLTVVGALLGVQPGESLRLVGRWSSHPRYVNRPGFARGWGSGHLAPLGDGGSIHEFSFYW